MKKKTIIAVGSIGICAIIIIILVICLQSGYKSIYSIDGAVKVDEPERAFFTDNFGYPMTPENYLQTLREADFAICYGGLKNCSMISYEIFDPTWYTDPTDTVTWYISTFDIIIDDPVRNLDGVSKVRVASATRFSEGYMLDSWPCTGGDIYSGNKGLFILNKITDDPKWSIGEGENEIKLIDYADYFLGVYWESDGVSFNYYYTDIKIDDIREGR